MIGLGTLPGGTSSTAIGVSADGSAVVGYVQFSSGTRAFFWDSFHGMRVVQDMLVDDFGLDLTGWKLEGATATSADGQVIVGYGTNPSGQTEAWLAMIPEPGTGLLVMTGVLGLSASRRRRAN
jgi:uncharacterized membrane protein